MSASTPPALPAGALERVFDRARSANTLDSFTLKDVRRHLDEDEEWTCADAEWKTARAGIKEEWTKLMDAHTAEATPSPVKKPKKEGKKPRQRSSEAPKGHTKYSRAAERNVKVLLDAFGGFLGGLAGDAGGGDSSAGEALSEGERSPSEPERGTETPKNPPPRNKRKRVVQSESEGGEAEPAAAQDVPAASAAAVAPPTDRTAAASTEPAPPPTKRPRKQPNPQRRVGPAPPPTEVLLVGTSSPARPPAAHKPSASTSTFKAPASAAQMNDSDLSELEDSGPLPGARPKKGKDRAGEGDDAKKSGTKGKSKGKGKEKEATQKKRERKVPTPKPGDAPKGTAAQEDRITKLKSLLTAAAAPRPFTASTGAERTLPVERRTEILETLLASLGLAVKGERLPSLSKAKEVGEKRLLAKEMEELGGSALRTGLRTGKDLHVPASPGEDEGPGRGASGSSVSPSVKKKKEVLVERKKFGAFLGDQSEDSD